MSSEHQSRSTSLISLEDLTGLGIVGNRIVDAVEMALGGLWRRAHLKEKEDAEEYRITALARAEAERRRLLSEVERELAERAEHRLLGQEIQREKNLEIIIKEAINQSIEKDQSDQDRVADDEVIDPDWMTRFRNLAQDISHRDMQTVWGRLLESEARNPGKYSFKALEILSNMRRSDADLFQRLCHLAFEDGQIFQIENRGSRGGMRDFLNVQEISQLMLMQVIENSTSESVFTPDVKTFQISNNGSIVRFTRNAYEKEDIHISKWVMTPMGWELAQLFDSKPNIQYLRTFKNYMATRAYNIEVIIPAGEGLGRVIV